MDRRTDGAQGPPQSEGASPMGPKQVAGLVGSGIPQPAGDSQDLQSAQPSPLPTAEAWLRVSAEQAGVPAMTPPPWTTSAALPPPGVLGPGRQRCHVAPPAGWARGARQPSFEGTSPPSRLARLMPRPGQDRSPGPRPPCGPRGWLSAGGFQPQRQDLQSLVTKAVATAVLYKALRNPEQTPEA